MPRTSRLALALAVLLAASTAAPAQSWEEDLPRVVQYSLKRPGWRNYGRPLREKDPVQALTAEELAKYENGVSDEELVALMTAFVNRAEAAYAKLGRPPEGLMAFLKENPELRETYLLALSPFYDALGSSMKILDELRRAEPEKAVEYPHLAVAVAVVWDQVDAVHGSRFDCVHGVSLDQYMPLPEPLQVFRYYTDKKRQRMFVFKMKDLQWPLCVYLADNDVSAEEAEWALARFGRQRKAIGGVYSRVQYDYSKLSNPSGKLGTNKYILPNLLEYGGICGDQAHFCSRVAKCFGIPAVKASGLSRYGGVGHAFTCFCETKKKRPVLSSTGRYFHDFYYTGRVFDPQTRTEILDRHLAMLLDGATLSYEKYMQSLVLTRMARQVYGSNPAVSLRFTKRALNLNWFYGPAWALLMRHVRDGNLKPVEGVNWANLMMKYVKDHPDLTLGCFATFLDCIPAGETKKRQKFYTQAFRLYEDRPDLQIDLRAAQCDELLAAGKQLEALPLYLKTTADHGKQGRILLPLVRKAVDIVKKRKLHKQAIPFFDKLAMRFPKKRGGRIAKAFQDLVDLLVPIYEEAGKHREAASLRRKAGG